MLGELQVTIGTIEIADPNGAIGIGGFLLLLVVIIILRKAEYPLFVR
jgi:hypothetical protein